MTDMKEAAPKRTAMQVALDAERLAQQALDAVEVPDLTGPFDQLRERVGELIDWQAGFLGADGPNGVSKVAEQSEAAMGVTRELALDFGKLHGRVGLVDDRLRNVEEWQAATLDEGNLGTGDALAERLAEVEAQFRELRAHPSTMVNGDGGHVHAPHVLSLIAQLQRRVFEISKDKEFRAENNRGETTQSYSFRGVDQAQNAIGTAQREIGLIGPAVTIIDKSVSSETVQKSATWTQVWTSVSVTVRYTFQSPVDGSTWSTEGCGMGRDMGDKAESKALAGAFKYALFHGLNIPVKGVFVDAETADPRIEREIGAEHRQQDAGEQGRTYGHGQPPADEPAAEVTHHGGYVGDQPAEQWRAEQQAAGHGPQAAPAQREADNRSPEQLARDALNAVRRAANANEAAGVWSWIYQRQLLTVPVYGVPVGQHMLAAIRLLPGGAQIELPGWGQFR